MEAIKEQEILELFPIYVEDLTFEADDVFAFPIFESDILSESI